VVDSFDAVCNFLNMLLEEVATEFINFAQSLEKHQHQSFKFSRNMERFSYTVKTVHRDFLSSISRKRQTDRSKLHTNNIVFSNFN